MQKVIPCFEVGGGGRGGKEFQICDFPILYPTVPVINERSLTPTPGPQYHVTSPGSRGHIDALPSGGPDGNHHPGPDRGVSWETRTEWSRIVSRAPRPGTGPRNAEE